MRVSRPHYRYLSLHLRFQTLQQTLQFTFYADWNAPLPIVYFYTSPQLRYMIYARVLSMHDRSTSELLRTLEMNGCFQANILAVYAIAPRLVNLIIIWGP